MSIGEFDVPARRQLAVDRTRPDYAATLNTIREIALAAHRMFQPNGPARPRPSDSLFAPE